MEFPNVGSECCVIASISHSRLLLSFHVVERVSNSSHPTMTEILKFRPKTTTTLFHYKHLNSYSRCKQESFYLCIVKNKQLDQTVMYFNSIFTCKRWQKWLIIFGTNIAKSGYSGPREGQRWKLGEFCTPLHLRRPLWYILCSSVLQCTAPES